MFRKHNFSCLLPIPQNKTQLVRGRGLSLETATFHSLIIIMRKKLIPFIAFTVFYLISNGQGLIFEPNEFAKREKIDATRAELPQSISLKKFTPILYPQFGNTCVAHSFAVARTILLAKAVNWTDKTKITSLSFSPYYIYYRSKDDDDIGCANGLRIETAAKDVLNNGFAPLVNVEYPSYYPFAKEALCIEKNSTSYPPTMTEDEVAARKFKIDEIYRVSSIRDLKTALAAGMPTVACLFTPASFMKAKGDLWIPQLTDKPDKSIGHALLAIGYNDAKYGGAIELMNSWGDAWGNSGFIWVKYKDYLKWFVAGYAFYDDAQLKGNIDAPSISSKTVISKNTMKVKRGNGKYSSSFNNSQFIKAFVSK